MGEFHPFGVDPHEECDREIKRLEHENERLLVRIDECARTYGGSEVASLRSRLSAATAALEAEKNDAERYRWLRNFAVHSTERVVLEYCWFEMFAQSAAHLNAAIDAARREGGGE